VVQPNLQLSSPSCAEHELYLNARSDMLCSCHDTPQRLPMAQKDAASTTD
jgi:hypothetical protein